MNCGCSIALYLLLISMTAIESSILAVILRQKLVCIYGSNSANTMVD